MAEPENGYDFREAPAQKSAPTTGSSPPKKHSVVGVSSPQIVPVLWATLLGENRALCTARSQIWSLDGVLVPAPWDALRGFGSWGDTAALINFTYPIKDMYSVQSQSTRKHQSC